MAGITLIELLVVVAIIGILAAIAYPSYQRYVARTHRDAALACLSQEAQFMERFYTSKLTYKLDNPDDVRQPCEGENNLARRYQFSLVAGSLTASTYKLQAVPTQLQAANDTCGTLSLDQAGTRKPDDPQCYR